MNDDNPEALDLGNLPQINQVLDQRMHQLQRAEEHHHGRTAQFSDRLFDEAKPAGNRTYILANQLIEVAVENYHAVFALIQKGATPWAPYNLIRPAFEAAFYALWILEPQDSVQRLLRGLRVAVEDNRQSENWIRELIKIPNLTEDQRQSMQSPISRSSTSFRRDAEGIGVKWAQASQRITLIDELLDFGCPGLHLFTFNRPDAPLAILDHLRVRDAARDFRGGSSAA